MTIQNNSGTEFPQARIKLMAGDVAKLRDMNPRPRAVMYAMAANQSVEVAGAVTQQAFDDFHLYDLNRTVSLRAGETKQVQFLEAADVAMSRVYEYDGAQPTQINFYPGYHNDQPGFSIGSNTRVTVRAEIRNAVANHLGMPLPAGRIRLYRRDAGGQMEFVGEGTIPHTPTDETVKVPVGSAFDVTGERRQTDFHSDQRAHTIDETFEITLKNQKSTAVPVAIVEHMNRGHELAAYGAVHRLPQARQPEHRAAYRSARRRAGEGYLQRALHLVAVVPALSHGQIRLSGRGGRIFCEVSCVSSSVTQLSLFRAHE